MKGFPVMVMALLLGGALAIAQVCPSGYPVTVIPSGTPIASGTVMVPMSAYPSSVSSVPLSAYPSTVSSLPMICPSGVSALPMTSVSAYPSGYTSQDTALILNEIRAMRGDIRALALTSQGQMLASRINNLIAQEQTFRQAIAANPNLPNAQMTAFQLTAEAQALNRDIAAFNTQLSMVPVDQRPYMAQSLNSFDVAVWQPTLQALSTYQAQFAAGMNSYQPAFAANPWLQTWVTGYQTALVPLNQTPQVIASVRWWNQPMVLGSTEYYTISSQPFISGQPMMAGQTMMLPSGAVIFIPAGSAYSSGMMVPSTQPGTVGATGTTTTIGTTTGGATTETPAY